MVEGGWSAAEVEERLVEAMRFWWRVEGRGWPFAADGPWHLVRKEWGDWDARDPKPIRTGLTPEQVSRRDEASEWLRWIGERDRALVVSAIAQLAAGKKQVRWSRVRAALAAQAARGEDDTLPGPRGLGQRYARALAGVARRLEAGSRSGTSRREEG